MINKRETVTRHAWFGLPIVMKRMMIRSCKFINVLLAVVAIAILFVTSGCQGCMEEKVKVTENDAAIRFDTLMHDFGNIPRGEKREFDFIFHNIGNKPLVIHEVNPTCGCIKEHHTTRAVMPGRSGKITAVYNDIYALPGHFHKALGVSSNNKSGYITLIVEGNIVEK